MKYNIIYNILFRDIKYYTKILAINIICPSSKNGDKKQWPLLRGIFRHARYYSVLFVASFEALPVNITVFPLSSLLVAIILIKKNFLDYILSIFLTEIFLLKISLTKNNNSDKKVHLKKNNLHFKEFENL